MADQPERPRRTLFTLFRWLLRGALVFLAIVVICLLAAPVMLPWLADTFVTPLVRDALGVAHFAADIRRLDLSGMDVGAVDLGPAAGVRLRAMQLDWTLTGLMRKRLKALHLLGLEVVIQESEAGWTIAGLPAGTSRDTSAPAVNLSHIDAITVEGRIKMNGRALALEAPLVINGTLAGAEHASFDLRTALAGQQVLLHLEGSYAHKHLRLSTNLPPARLAALLSLVPGLNLPLSGTLAARADLAADRGTADLTLEAAQALVAGQAVAQDGSTTMRAQWNGVQAGLTSTPLRLSTPWRVELELRHARLDPAVQPFFSCGWRLRFMEMPELGLTQPLALNGTLEAERGKESVGAKITAECPPFKISHKEGVLNVSEIKLLSNLTWTGPDGLHGEVEVTGGRLTGKHNTLSFATTPVEGSLRFAQNGRDLNASVKGQGQFTDGGLAGTFSLYLPLTWPVPTKEAGRLSGDLTWKKKSLAKISTQLKQSPAGLGVDGQLTMSPLAVRVSLKAELDFARLSASRLEIKSAQTLTLPADLARFNPALGQLTGSARLKLDSRLDFSQGAPQAPLEFALNDLAIHAEHSKTTLEGGQFALAFTNALDLRSDPDQRFTFALLQLGAIRLEKGEIHFQMEKPTGFLVEGCSLHWAGGRVGTHSFRINPAVEDYRVELFCDRVQLAQALEQFGLTQVQGGGSANGRIPLHYAKGSLTFYDGFLYSTPGEKGVLRVKGTEILTAGVAPDSPQFGQLDLAAEALKDFAYEWAKIGLNTQGRELVVALELDGKPSRPLPFVYDKTIGGFTRVTAASPGSAFQGINLNVNFRLPVDQLLRYRNLLELINKGG